MTQVYINSDNGTVDVDTNKPKQLDVFEENKNWTTKGGVEEALSQIEAQTEEISELGKLWIDQERDKILAEMKQALTIKAAFQKHENAAAAEAIREFRHLVYLLFLDWRQKKFSQNEKK